MKSLERLANTGDGFLLKNIRTKILLANEENPAAVADIIKPMGIDAFLELFETLAAAANHPDGDGLTQALQESPDLMKTYFDNAQKIIALDPAGGTLPQRIQALYDKVVQPQPPEESSV